MKLRPLIGQAKFHLVLDQFDHGMDDPQVVQRRGTVLVELVQDSQILYVAITVGDS